MAKIFTPLAPNVPIVDKDGNPTPYFQRIMQELTDNVINEIVLEGVGGDPGDNRILVWDTVTGVLTFATLSEVIDWTDDTHGAILFRGSTEWEALAPGTSGDVLTTNGASADPTWETPSSGGGGLVLLEQHTASSSASLDFTTCISATYDTYLIEFVNIVPATDNVNLNIRFSTNGGSSYDSSALYDFAGHQTNTGTFQGATNAGSSQAQGQLIQGIDTTGASNSVNGSIKLHNPGGSIFKAVVGQFSAVKNDGIFYMHNVAGRYRNTTAVNAFQFYFSSGNIASGTIRVYGLAK